MYALKSKNSNLVYLPLNLAMDLTNMTLDLMENRYIFSKYDPYAKLFCDKTLSAMSLS